MNGVLLDTHTFIWSSLGEPKLSHRARSLLLDSAQPLYLSHASIWEMAIKVQKKLLFIPGLLEQLIPRALECGFQLLPIEVEHLTRLQYLPLHHPDPFDRLLISQSQVTGMPILGTDVAFDAYDVERIW